MRIQLQRHGEGRVGCWKADRGRPITPTTPSRRPLCRRSGNSFVGGWLNRDPIGELDGINLYGFLRNGVPNGVDPFGLLQLYIGAGAELTAISGIKFGWNVVFYDSENINNLGFHLYGGHTWGVNVGVDAHLGFVSDSVDGTTSGWDANLGVASAACPMDHGSLWDPTGAELGIGPGVGGSYSPTTTGIPLWTVGDVVDLFNGVKDWFKELINGWRRR